MDQRCLQMGGESIHYVLFSRHWDVVEYGALHDVLFSDHYPVEAAFRLRPGR